MPDAGTALIIGVGSGLGIALARRFAAAGVLAEVYYQTHAQPRSRWSFEVDIRPWREEFI